MASVRNQVLAALLTALSSALLQAASCKGAETLLSAALSALDRGEIGHAESAIDSLQASHPNCDQLLLLVGRARTARKDYAAAFKMISRYTQAAPADPRGFVTLAELMFAINRPSDADAASVKALSVGPNNVEALILRGRILGMKGEASQAEELLLKACKLAPSNPQAHFELGVFYDRRQATGKAAEQFEKVVRLSPSNPRAYDYLALSLEPLGQFERAEWAYKQGLKVNKEPLFDAFLDYNYGRFLTKLNRLAEAAEHLNKAVELTPNTRAVYYERAKLHEKLENYPQALRDSEKALAINDPGAVILDLQLYYQLARLYTRVENQEMAAKYSKLAQDAKVPASSRRRGGR